MSINDKMDAAITDDAVAAEVRRIQNAVAEIARASDFMENKYEAILTLIEEWPVIDGVWPV